MRYVVLCEGDGAGGNVDAAGVTARELASQEVVE